MVGFSLVDADDDATDDDDDDDAVLGQCGSGMEMFSWWFDGWLDFVS